jgi:hypothetical protein
MKELRVYDICDVCPWCSGETEPFDDDSVGFYECVNNDCSMEEFVIDSDGFPEWRGDNNGLTYRKDIDALCVFNTEEV